MAVYFITGKLGAGKTLLTVAKIKEYLKAGKPVATNLDINLDKMFSKDDRKHLTRLPDKPRGKDLVDLGCAYGDPLDDDYDEKKFGLIVLDEVGVWLNSRDWKDKDRKSLIDYFRHARKYRYDLFLIVQDIDSVDKMIRKTICEHLVICLRSDRLKIPYLGTVFRFLGFSGNFSKNHVAHVLYGDSPEGTLVDVWKYKAEELYGCYKTGQIFRDDIQFNDDDTTTDMRASYTFLPAYYLTGQGLIAYHQEQLANINSTISELKGEKKPMGRQHKKLNNSIPDHFKIGALVAVGAVYFLFNSPFDNTLLSDSDSSAVELIADSSSILSVSSDSSPSFMAAEIPSNVLLAGKLPKNFITELFDNYRSRLSGYGGSKHNRYVLIDFYEGSEIVETITMNDLRINGFSVIKNRNAVNLTDGYNKYTVRNTTVRFVSGERDSFNDVKDSGLF